MEKLVVFCQKSCKNIKNLVRHAGHTPFLNPIERYRVLYMAFKMGKVLRVSKNLQKFPLEIEKANKKMDMFK